MMIKICDHCIRLTPERHCFLRAYTIKTTTQLITLNYDDSPIWDCVVLSQHLKFHNHTDRVFTQLRSKQLPTSKL